MNLIKVDKSIENTSTSSYLMEEESLLLNSVATTLVNFNASKQNQYLFR